MRQAGLLQSWPKWPLHKGADHEKTDQVPTNIHDGEGISNARPLNNEGKNIVGIPLEVSKDQQDPKGVAIDL